MQLQDIEDGGFFAPSVTLASGHTIAEAEPALAAEIARLRDTPVGADELAEAKNEILAGALAERETFDGRAFAIGESLVRTGDPSTLDRRLALIGKVTAADVQRVARTYLKPEARVDFRYLDERQRPAGQRRRLGQPGADAEMGFGPAGDPRPARAGGGGPAPGPAAAERRRSR